MPIHETHEQLMLDELRTRLLVMCATLEEVVASACAALRKGDMDLAQKVIEHDNEVDDLENEIDKMALSLMVRNQPVARDLRFVLSAVRMVIDLERIGDEATNIADCILRMRGAPYSPASERMTRVIHLAQETLHDAIAAFRDEDIELALKVCRGQNAASQMELCFNGLLEERGVEARELAQIVLIAHALNTIFRCSFNIAEHAYFMTTGVSIKHRKAEEL